MEVWLELNFRARLRKARNPESYARITEDSWMTGIPDSANPRPRGPPHSLGCRLPRHPPAAGRGRMHPNVLAHHSSVVFEIFEI